jgi:hypothetical protein
VAFLAHFSEVVGMGPVGLATPLSPVSLPVGACCCLLAWEGLVPSEWDLLVTHIQPSKLQTHAIYLQEAPCLQETAVAICGNELYIQKANVTTAVLLLEA